MLWHDLFEHREGILYWKVKSGTRAHVGDPAGCISSIGYWQVRYKRKTYRCHRIIYEMVYGKIPNGYEIDHKNGVRNDNRIENLRLATRRENIRNSKKFRNNTSGFKGVYWHQATKKWRASIMIDGRSKSLGYFCDITSAADARKSAEQKYFGEFST